MNLDALAPIIEEIIKDSLNANAYFYGKNNKRGNRVASGTLRDSIKAEVEPNKQGVSVIKITAIDGKRLEDTYAYWLINDRKPGPAIGSQKGRKRKGKPPYQPGVFVSAIIEWIKNKPSFTIKNFKTGSTLPKTDKNIKSAAWVVARSIAEFGFENKPMNFIDISIDKIKKDPRIIEIIEETTFDDLLKQIEGL